MKTFDGYSKEKFSDTSVLLAGGGSKELSNFIGTLNWDSTNRKLQYKKIGDTNWNDLVTFGSHAFDSTDYLPISGGTMKLGEGLKFHADENYFGTNLDARIISLLDGNDTVCDGGLIIDERATSGGKEYITELLRIRDSEFKWKGQNILHAGNSNISGEGGNTWGSSITVKINGTSKTLTIPSNPNTDYRVTQSETTTSNYRPLVVGYTNVSTAGSGMTGSVTNQVYLSNKFYVQPSTGNLYATTFVGALSGNASSATKLTSSAGNAALPIYFSDGKPTACTASSLFSTLSNSDNDISITVAGQNRTLTVNYANSAKNLVGYPQIKYKADLDAFVTSNTIKHAMYQNAKDVTETTKLGIPLGDGMVMSWGWPGTTNYAWQIAIEDDGQTDHMAIRNKSNNTWGAWRIFLTSANYTTYTVKKDGTGASGTWGINISGNAHTVDGYHATYGNNKPWGTIPAITTDGWMDIGMQLEFHYDNTTGSDYSTVLRCSGNHSNIVDLPSLSGTLALTSQLPTKASWNYDDRYLKLSGGTMTGTIITPGNDSVVIKPAKNNYDQIGGEGQVFYKIWATNFYGTLHGNCDGNAATATNADTVGGCTPSDFIGTFCGRDFTNGTLIKTSIDYSVTNGDPFYMEIKGNTYSRFHSCYTVVQGYIYNNTIINLGYSHMGYQPITGLVAMNLDGKLCFWFPRQGYWEGYSIVVYRAHDHKYNRITSITNSADPGGTKRVSFSSVKSIYQDESGNATISGSYYANSDIRYKLIQYYLLNKVNLIAELPIFTYYWNDNQHDDKLHIGSSAQAVKEVFPELVTYDESKDFYNLDYATLGTIAGITACKELVNQKSEIDLLKERIEQLEQQLKMINDYRRC